MFKDTALGYKTMKRESNPRISFEALNLFEE
jgi:hypothetical protein